MTFQSFFHDIFQFFMTLGLAVTFEHFQNYPCFRVIQLKRHKLQCLPESQIRKFLDFQVFHDLYEPRVTAKETDPRPGRYLSHNKQDM